MNDPKTLRRLAATLRHAARNTTSRREASKVAAEAARLEKRAAALEAA